MATAPVEVFKGTANANGYGTFYNMMFDMANFFSQSAHFEIIDSYTGHYNSNKGGSPSYTAKRWKGDPIGDDDPAQPGYKVWETSDDVGTTWYTYNGWFIVECQTEHPDLATIGYTDLPKWQCKFQFCGDDSYLADPTDPSGLVYPKNHNVRRQLYFRFSPYGEWNKADSNPDFTPATPPASGDVSTENHVFAVGNSSGRACKFYQIHANGCVIIISRYDDGNNQFYRLATIIGDVIPLVSTYMSMPRGTYGNGTGVGIVGESTTLFLTNTWSNYGSDYATANDGAGGFSFWDKNEALVQSYYRCDEKDHLASYLVSRLTAPSELDLLPFIPIIGQLPSPRQVFYVPYVRRTRNPGAILHADKSWFGMSDGWSPVVPWDGTSGVY